MERLILNKLVTFFTSIVTQELSAWAIRFFIYKDWNFFWVFFVGRWKPQHHILWKENTKDMNNFLKNKNSTITTYDRQPTSTAHAAIALAAVLVSSSFGILRMSTKVLQPLHRSISSGALGSLASSAMAPTIWSWTLIGLWERWKVKWRVWEGDG